MDMLGKGTAWLVVVLTSLAIGMSGLFSAANAQLKITGCLTSKGKLKNVEFGENPRKECKKNQTLIMLPITAKTDDLMEDVSSLESKDQVLMEKDTTLMNDVGGLQAKDLELMGKDAELMDKDTALMSDVTGLQAKDVELMDKDTR